MTREPFFAVPEAFYKRAFWWLRVASVVAAVAFGGAAAIWSQYDIPLVVTPAIMAALAGAIAGWIGAGKGRTEAMREFYSNFWVKVQLERTHNVAVVDMFEEMVPDRADRRKIHRLRAAGRSDIYVLNAQRFIELLVSRSTEDLDKATEHALAVAWQRSCSAMHPEMEPILSKNFREVFKGDLSGSMVRLISTMGGRIIEELAKEAEPPKEEEEVFTLQPLPVKSAAKRGRKKTV